MSEVLMRWYRQSNVWY